MKSNLVREFYKFRHQRIPLYGVIALLLLMLYSAFDGTKFSRLTISQGFGAGQWIILILITVGSTFVDMEYQNGTIITLFYKNSNRVMIYLDKLLIIILYGFSLVIFSTIFTFIFKAILVGQRYNWRAIYGQHSLFNNLMLNMLGSVVYMLFIVTLAFLLVSLIKVNAAVVGIGFIIVFWGSYFSSLLIIAVPGLSSIMKWNPLNMIYVISQLTNSGLAKFTHLNADQLIIGNFVYALLFVALGYLSFKKRRV
ncbi:MAG: ABC transporter permease [Lentilactobacillus buchneri]|nr:ABC transporter permease [Lentilactobacillus buchneri]MCI2019012.1 ABC transporter permease [Lentilactobacillus buchneri]